MININLLPKESKLKIYRSKKSANIFSWCLVAIIICCFLCFAIFEVNNYFQIGLQDTKTEIEKVNSSLKSFDKLQKQALFINDRVALAKSIEGTNAIWSVIISSLINSVPENVQFTSFVADISKTPNFTVQAKTSSERDAIKFKEKLESSDYFKDVSFKSATIATGGEENADGPQLLDFTLEFNLENYAPKATSGGSK